MLNSYKDLIIWQKAMALVKEVYRLTKYFPKSEVFGLVSQMRRAAVSIPSNIAEGYGRKSRKEFHHFLSIALGSAAELETQILLAESLDFLKDVTQFNNCTSLLHEVMKMLNKIIVNSRTDS